MSAFTRQISAEIVIMKSADVKLASDDGKKKLEVIAIKKMLLNRKM